MKYTPQNIFLSPEQRKSLNEKIICLIGSGDPDASGITAEDIYNTYTGDGGLHGLHRSDYDNYHQYSAAKKEIENGQFFTPANICELVAESLRPGSNDLVADLTCGMGNFFNFMPVEANLYGCEIDIKACEVARFLYPDAHLTRADIRTYDPQVHFDYVVGNPPFNMRWRLKDGEFLSQLYYCIKAAELLKPLGIMALVVPCSFLADDFADGAMIRQMEKHFSFLGQVALPTDAFMHAGVSNYPTKLQFWQKKSEAKGWQAKKYFTEIFYTLPSGFDPKQEARSFYENILMLPKSDLEHNKHHILLELARNRHTSAGFTYEVQKLLYHIKAHPATRDKYTRCCDMLYRFYTQKPPENMSYLDWESKKLTEQKVLSHFRRVLKRQNKKPDRDMVVLVKQDYCFQYKAYSRKVRQRIPPENRQPIPIYQAVLDDTPERYPGFERLRCPFRKWRTCEIGITEYKMLYMMRYLSQ